MNNTDMDAAKELGLTGVKKHMKYTSQVEMELDWLHDRILILAIFIKHLRRLYNNKKEGQNMSIRQNIDSECISLFFVQLHNSS